MYQGYEHANPVAVSCSFFEWAGRPGLHRVTKKATCAHFEPKGRSLWEAECVTGVTNSDSGDAAHLCNARTTAKLFEPKVRSLWEAESETRVTISDSGDAAHLYTRGMSMQNL